MRQFLSIVSRKLMLVFMKSFFKKKKIIVINKININIILKINIINIIDYLQY